MTIRFSPLAVTLALFSAFFSTTSAVAELDSAELNNDDLFRVVVFEDSANGEALMKRDVVTAIDDLAPRVDNAKARFVERNNLCAAYIVAKNVEEARDVCEAAVKIGNRRVRDASVWSAYSLRRNFAVALTNRGVLNALVGETDAAARDFEKAARMNRTMEEPRANLERLAERAPRTASITSVK